MQLAPRATLDHTGAPRPLFRGWIHAVFLTISIPAIIWLLVSTKDSLLPVAVYSISLMGVLAVSSSYHILARAHPTQKVMQRVDRAMIFVLIAGTYTPVVLSLVEKPYSQLMLVLVWIGAAAGVVFRSLGKLPKTMGVLYVALGWVSLLVAPAILAASPIVFSLLVLGGIAYTAGAVLFALQIPKLQPRAFGFHEVFHSFTGAGFVSHFVAIALLVLPS